MTKSAKIPAGDREFLGLVSRAAFVNPFGEERTDLDRQIAGRVGGVTRTEVVRRVAERVFQRVESLEASGNAHLGVYSGDDHVLMRNVFLFEGFYRFAEAFDRLIQEQLRSGASPCDVEFAPETLSLLRKRGFSEADSVRAFGLFYQLRRAFYFIDRALIGTCPAMKTLRRRLWNNVFTRNIEWYGLYLWDRMEDFSTFLLGETGTGKGQAAAAIGRSGFIPFDEHKRCFVESFTRNFISINLSQYPENLIESELFGYKKGAFTGAIQDHKGVFSLCTSHGSIFLDEVGEVAEPIQIKLLQVLQERTFSEVGSHEKLPFRGRVIAATNQNLKHLRRHGHLRGDFFYRLCSDIIKMPTLRERLSEHPGELDVLIHHLVTRMAGRDLPEVVREVRDTLRRDLPRDYPWPGNVREMEQAVRQVLLAEHYWGDPWAPGMPAERDLLGELDEGKLDAQGLMSIYCHKLYARHGSYEEVARRLKLDWRTVKKHVVAATGDSSRKSLPHPAF
ncbi:MAG TPA: sigma 54-interacting transcriptional regulator [Deferrisomatales bacterium]|nr:sigma 54-interacting transcriptional regulator [Deferrisomatales bacterium]